MHRLTCRQIQRRLPLISERIQWSAVLHKNLNQVGAGNIIGGRDPCKQMNAMKRC